MTHAIVGTQNNMTHQEQRLAIAQACGLPTSPLYSVPDYPNDLNKMHEAELVLEYWDGEYRGEGTWAPEAYMNHLQDIVGNDDWKFSTATAAQRAEAFCRTIPLFQNALPA